MTERAGTSKRWMRRVTSGAVLAAVAVASSCATSAYHARLEPSALVENLPASFAEANPTFDQRVRSTFPVGSSERRMLTVLQAQGFEPDWPEGASVAKVAVRRWLTLFCNMRAEIEWTATEAGRIESVQGRFGEAGCL